MDLRLRAFLLGVMRAEPRRRPRCCTLLYVHITPQSALADWLKYRNTCRCQRRAVRHFGPDLKNLISPALQRQRAVTPEKLRMRKKFLS